MEAAKIIVEVAAMKQYHIIHGCLSTLKSSRIDVITKLRMENLLGGLMAVLPLDLEREITPDLEDLPRHVKDFCTGESAGGARELAKHVRKVHSAMAGA